MGELEALGFNDVQSGFQAAVRDPRSDELDFSDRNLGAFRSWYVVSGVKA